MRVNATSALISIAIGTLSALAWMAMRACHPVADVVSIRQESAPSHRAFVKQVPESTSVMNESFTAPDGATKAATEKMATLASVATDASTITQKVAFTFVAIGDQWSDVQPGDSITFVMTRNGQRYAKKDFAIRGYGLPFTVVVVMNAADFWNAPLGAEMTRQRWRGQGRAPEYQLRVGPDSLTPVSVELGRAEAVGVVRWYDKAKDGELAVPQ